MELVKLLPVHRYSVDIFSYADGVLTEIRIPLKLVVHVRDVRIVALFISSYEQTEKIRVYYFPIL